MLQLFHQKNDINKKDIPNKNIIEMNSLDRCLILQKINTHILIFLQIYYL